MPTHCFPWPGRHDHLNQDTIDKWIDRCNRFYTTPTYSVPVYWSSEEVFHQVCSKLQKANGVLGLSWGPNEKQGATNADPKWDATSNDQEWAGKLATLNSIVSSYGVTIAGGSIDVECYVWERYTPISGPKLSKSKWNTARKARLKVLEGQFITAFGLTPSMYGAMRSIPQVRSNDLGVSGWGVSPNIDGKWDLGMYDGNWWHYPHINSAAHAMTMRVGGETRKVVPYHWLGIYRDRQRMKDMAMADDSLFYNHTECGRSYQKTIAAIDHLWAYMSVSDAMLAEVGLTRDKHEVNLELALDYFYHGLYKPLTEDYVRIPPPPDVS